MTKLLLGSEVGDLGVQLIKGEPWTCTRRMRRREVVSGKVVWVPTAWPEAPELYFPELDLSIPSLLSVDPDTNTANALATWHMTSPQSNLMRTGMSVRLRLFGETAFEGDVTCRS